MRTNLFFVLFFSFYAHAICGQQLFENSEKSFGLSLGVVHIPRGTAQPYILSYYFQDTGPMITASMDYKKKSNSSHSFHARYAFLSSIKDTIVTPALYPSSIEKYYDLK